MPRIPTCGWSTWLLDKAWWLGWMLREPGRSYVTFTNLSSEVMCHSIIFCWLEASHSGQPIFKGRLKVFLLIGGISKNSWTFFFQLYQKNHYFPCSFFFLIEVSLINNVVLIPDKTLRGKHRKNT